MIADRNKVCDCLRSYGNTLLRSSAIVCDPAIAIAKEPPAIVCDHLRSIVIMQSYGESKRDVFDGFGADDDFAS